MTTIAHICSTLDAATSRRLPARASAGTEWNQWRRATKSNWKNSKGEYDSRTEWHRVTAWSKLGEFAGKLEKGAHVQIEGELRYREYHKNRGSDADATPIKQRVAEIHANRILKLDRAAKQDEPAPESDSAELPVEEPAA